MLRPPPIRYLPMFPVTGGVALLAIISTLQWWLGKPIDFMEMNGRVWDKWELWRAFTATLPHVNAMHLIFNLYWLWVFGTLVERVYGHIRCGLIFLVLAFGSMLAEFSLLSGGVGLSGVGYGLWGMIWVLEQRDPRFHGAVDAQTSLTFVVWFFICIATTITGIMPVANIAHGMGACLGALLGLIACGEPRVKSMAAAGLSVILALVVLGSTVFWPKVNLSSFAEDEIEMLGIAELQRDDAKGSLKYLELAVTMRHPMAGNWNNLGIAYERLGRYPEALAAFEHAASLPDADNDMQRVALELKAALMGSTNGVGK